MFRDLVDFHEKFGIVGLSAPDHSIPEDLLKFRAKFMLEEIDEWMEAQGWILGPDGLERIEGAKMDAAKALDGLVDLVYVAIGTAYIMGFDKFDEAWNRVHAANMRKVRALRESDSARGSTYDVVKPAGWTAPDLSDLV